MISTTNYPSSAVALASQASKLTVYTNPEPALESAGEPKDREVTRAVLDALHQLQEAFDTATLAGLIVEPSFKRVPNRFSDRGSDAETYLASVEVYRKLA